MSELKKISVHKDIKKAHTLQSEFYTNEYFFKLSLKKIFNSSWQYIIHKKKLESIIQYPFFFLKDTINQPLVLTLKNGDIYCLSNVCTHRGNIICTKKNTDKLLKCNYHGRLFELSGEFKSTPGFKEALNFPLKKDNLKLLPIMNWNDYIFTSLSKNNIFVDIFDKMKERLDWYPFDELNYCEKSSKEYIIDAHWALYCENYLEGFHVPYVHEGLNSNIDFSSYNTELLDNGVLQYTYSKSIRKTFNNINGSPKSAQNIYAYYYWFFPNIMFNYYSWGLSINIIEPINKNKSKIKFLSFPLSNKQQPVDDLDSVDLIELEDQKVVQQVQRGVESPFYNKGRYSPDYEKGVHHFHRLLCRYLN